MGNGWRCLVGLGALLACVGAGMGAAAAPESRPLGVLSATPKGVTASGLRSLDGADGVTALVSSPAGGGLTNAHGVTPAATFLYFDVEAQPPAGAWGPVYVSVEYFDRAIGAALGLQYDSATGDTQGARYLGADDQAGGWFTGARKWRQACFLLRKPLFQGRENLGADFRLSGSQLLLRRVSVSTSRPASWDRLSRMTVEKVKPLVRIGTGGQLIVGGFDPARTSDGIPQSRALEAAVPALKSLGVTSHEGYVRWNLCEPSPGKYDWSVYDRFVKVYQRHGLKWVPFLIIGSAYSLPNWYYKKPGFQGYVCLEHGQECDVQSLWNPVLRKHVAQFIKAFLDHYRGTGVIESVLLGVTGNYGEAIYPATGNDWTADIHGPTHTHPGFWAGDPYAVKSFRAWLTRKYKSSAGLRGAWGASAPELVRARPFLRDAAPNDRAWLDFCAWYIGSMTDWSRFWLRQTRASLPKAGIYLCTGGHAPAEHGSDFGDQCKAAAEVKGGVRITNEGSDYKANFSLTRWVASGGEQYGAYYSFEPAGEVNPIGVIGRVYNATASGALGLHYYYPNLYGSEEAQRNFVKWGGQFRQRRPVVEISVHYPETYIRLKGQDFLRLVQPLRDRFDFNYLSDAQIADGGLKRVRALVLMQGNVAEASTWRAITDWVRGGGLLLVSDGVGRLRTVEGDERFQQALLGAGANHGKGRVLTSPAAPDSAGYREFLARSLASARELSADSRRMVAADGREDGLFATLCVSPALKGAAARRELLWLNYTAQAAPASGARKVALPAYSIVSEPISQASSRSGKGAPR